MAVGLSGCGGGRGGWAPLPQKTIKIDREITEMFR
jgi:hypothetical protein